MTEARPVVWIELRAQKQEYDPAAAILARHGYRLAQRLGPNDFLFSAG